MMANNYRLTFKGGQVLDLKLREVNNNLSAKERLVADYILANKPLLKSMSIQTLAKANDVSTTTILRLCHKLGYQGFSDLKIDLITSSGHPQHDKVLQEDINLDDSVESVNHKIQLIEKSSIDETHAIVNIEQLELAIALIRKSNKIVIYGAGSSGLVGKELEYQLIKIKKDVSCHADYSIQYSIVNTLDEHDLVIILSHSGENLESVKLLTMAQQLGVPSIAITKLLKVHYFSTPLWFLIRAVPCFLAVYFGGDLVGRILAAIPESILTGMGVAAKMIPAIGVCILLLMLLKGRMWFFFLLGFMLTTYLKLPIIPITFIALAFAVLYDMAYSNGQKAESSPAEKEQQSTTDTEEGYDL